ncbi:sensor histidine kinase [Thalassotalea atypica]|uniref:sensor histidine kinase n=1 Tax=Thalassotalea atypica TaxID=2054316 RepID=UPI0025726F34|nr:histidine kinase [Thalassotalea atypica]
MAASNSYRVSLHFERPVEWLSVWMEYLPWWGNWAIVAPLIIATTQVVNFDQRHLLSFALKSFGIMLTIMSLYWLLTILEVGLYRDGTITMAAIKSSVDRLLLSPIHMDFLVYLAVFCSGYSYSYYQRLAQQKRENEALSKQLVQVELHSLKSQLNPHFLFNTLNTIASLIRLEQKSKAITALTELSLMLRTVLENQKNQFIPLEHEIEFIQSYLSIQKIRFEDKILIAVDVEPSCLGIDIPCMLLQPLVENAIQHGSQLESDQNELRLTIEKSPLYLEIKLINKIPEKDEHKGFGLGLSNCRSRLEKLYGDTFALTLTPIENGYFETYLRLPIGGVDA